MRHAPAAQRGGEVSAGRTTPVERLLNHAAVLLVGLSGLLLAGMKYGLSPPEDPFTVVNHPLQPRMLHLHILVGPLLILAVGMMIRDHIVARLRHRTSRRGRRSGVLAVALFVPMIASGYLLQVVTSTGARRLLVWMHVTSGILYLAVYLGHLLATRLAARRAGFRRREGTLEGADLHLEVGLGRPAARSASRGGGVPATP